MTEGIKSNQRVKDFGEVYTPQDIVSDMVDLVTDKAEMEIDSTFLEPACGNGQFLIEILYRKLEEVKKLPVEERQIGMIMALCSVYGVDIQKDNVVESRNRMMQIIENKPTESFTRSDKKHIYEPLNLGIEITEGLRKVIEFILKNNIQWGDTLTNRHFVEKVKNTSKKKGGPRVNKNIGESDTATDEEQLVAINYKFESETVSMQKEIINEDAVNMPNPVMSKAEPINYMSMHEANFV